MLRHDMFDRPSGKSGINLLPCAPFVNVYLRPILFQIVSQQLYFFNNFFTLLSLLSAYLISS